MLMTLTMMKLNHLCYFCHDGSDPTLPPSTHIACPAPDPSRPPVWYTSTPTAIRILGDPPIYQYLKTNVWFNDQLVDSYLTLIHWRQSTYSRLENGLVPVFIHSTQVSPWIQSRLEPESVENPPNMAKWFRQASPFCW